ncbi:hypothetical protein [Nostoc sp.]
MESDKVFSSSPNGSDSDSVALATQERHSPHFSEAVRQRQSSVTTAGIAP